MTPSDVMIYATQLWQQGLAHPSLVTPTLTMVRGSQEPVVFDVIENIDLERAQFCFAHGCVPLRPPGSAEEAAVMAPVFATLRAEAAIFHAPALQISVTDGVQTRVLFMWCKHLATGSATLWAHTVGPDGRTMPVDLTSIPVEGYDWVDALVGGA